MGSLAVVGAGVIGLSIAWRAAQAGWIVRVIDPAVGRGATWVAGGMLAPISEGWPGEDVALDLGVESLLRWPAFADELGGNLITARGAITCAFDGADADDLATIAQWVSERGHDVELLNRTAVRELEPSLSHSVRRGLLAPSELAVDNRATVDALVAASTAAGVEFVAESVTDVDDVVADQVVVASGWAAARLCSAVPVRPVKGEILRVRNRSGSTPKPLRTVRASVNGRAVYLVPRSDGFVIGATQYEHGDDTAVTVAGVRDLLADAERVFPGLGDYELVETAAGLRPMSPDNVPLIDRLDDRVVVATGHGRGGMLMAPLTADAVVAELAGSPLPEAKNARLERLQ